MADGHSLIYFANKDILEDFDSFINNTFNIKYYENLYNHCSHIGHVRCSDVYWRRYKSSQKFFFSFYYMPEWIELAVEQFNSTFKNIKVILHRNINGADPTNNIIIDGNGNKRIRKYRIPVFEIKYKKGYWKRFQKYSNLFIHHYFRMLSPLETEQSLRTKEIIRMEVPPNNLDVMDLIISENNIGGRYRKLCEYNITREDLLRLDNLDLIKLVIKNKIIIGCYYRKQTAILQSLKIAENLLLNNDNKNKFEVGDYVETNIEGFHFFGNSRYGKVIEILSPTEIKIKRKNIYQSLMVVYSYLFDKIPEERYISAGMGW